MSVTQSEVDELREDMRRDLDKHAMFLGPAGLVRADVEEAFEAVAEAVVKLKNVSPVTFVYVLTGWITMMRRKAGAKTRKT